MDNSKPRPPVIPTGSLVHLKINQLRPNPGNPRRLFDPGPLQELRESIRTHGVLVPLTVYKLPGQDKYGILDGERRYRCCVDLANEGLEVTIPANVVAPPDQVASLIYMFNIHAFREQWELMPTALSLKQLIDQLGQLEKDEIHELTGLSYPQIERCLRILTFPDRFQKMSLEADPAERIPSNFWIELYPVLELAEKHSSDLMATLGRDGVTDRLVEKYRVGKIKSVVHFRRIVEAFDVSEDEEDVAAVRDRLREYILDPDLETRTAFDGFIRDPRRYEAVLGAADRFIRDIKRAKIDHTLEGKDALIERLSEVMRFIEELLESLAGSDPPERTEDEDEDEDE